MFDLFKRMWSNFRGGALSAAAFRIEQRIELGSAGFFPPDGWQAIKKTDNICVLRPSDDTRQLTISLLRFRSAPSFDAFKAICGKRINAERHELADGTIDTLEPEISEGRFTEFFSGKDVKYGRVFIGCLLLVGAELFTIYLEATGTSPQEHWDSFISLVSQFRTK